MADASTTTAADPSHVSGAADGPSLLARPAVAWPTLALAAFALGLWTLSLFMLWTGTWPAWVTIPLSTLAAYLAFTPMHDSAHRSLGKARALSELVGRLCAVPLLAPFPAFRIAHLEHHKHTNEPVNDPDLYSGLGNAWTRPLRWLTQDLHYYVFLYRNWGKQTVPARAEVLLMGSAQFLLVGWGMVSGHAVPVLLGCVVPARLAIALLAYTFDYLPHVPHRVRATESRYRATNRVAGRWLTPLLLHQNFHIIHHLYPGVPFYRYAAIWKAQEQELVNRGVQTVHVPWLRWLTDRD